MFGGVTAIRTSQFISINGYSNLYYGWGGEDDDIYERYAMFSCLCQMFLFSDFVLVDDFPMCTGW